MAYVSLYRKYRPQTFEDVVGQDHVTTTLRNSIKEGRVASGYLFTGTRGTAKTTCARIMAKALNCIGPDGTRTAPTPEPCGVCGPCRSIAASSFVDVLEMDAASHGKVDDVRDLVASIKFPPMEGRYKVYIIDEAHQLSRDAMDAFLKTLEEPPPQVVFVLATTELDKLPITIASRCQVYEFKRGSVAQISARLADVLAAEDVKADKAALTLIARAADGSYRDSLSLLEQVLAYSREHVTAKDVTIVLGTIGDDLLDQVVDLIADSDAAGAFALAGSILESGKDVRQFLKSLAERFRDMLFVGVGAKAAQAGEIDGSKAFAARAARFSPAAMLQALETLTAAENDTKRSNQHRLILEMALLKLMRLPSTAAAAPAAASNGHFAPTTPVIITPVVVAPLPDIPPLLSPEELPEEASDDTADDNADGDELTLGMDVPMPGDDDLDSMPLDADEEDEAGDLEAGDLPSLLVDSPEAHEQADELLQVQQVASDTVSAPAPAPLPPAETSPELRRLQKSWQEVVNLTGSKSKAAARDVSEAKPIAIIDSVVALEFAHEFHFERVNGKEAMRHFIEENICKTLDAEPGTYRVKCLMAGQALPSRTGAAARAASAAAPAPATEPPGAFVQKVIAVFGGDLLDDNEA